MRRRADEGSRSSRLAGLALGAMGWVLVVSTPLGAQQILVGPPSVSSVAPGELVEIPILVDMSNAGGLNIASLQLEVAWNAAHLQYLAFNQSDLPENWTGTPNETSVASGSFAWAGFSPTGTTGSFVAVTLLYGGIAPDGTTTAICVTVTAAGDEGGTSLLPVMPTPSCGECCVGVSGLWGDVNDDGQVNIIDAQQIARYAVGLPPPPDPGLIAEFCDVNQDGVCNIIDAQQVARWAIGLMVCENCIPGIVKPGCVAVPDLVPTEVSGPASGVPGGAASVTVTAANVGDGPVGGGWLGEIRLSMDGVCTSDDRDPYALVYTETNALGPGDATTATRTATIPSDIAPGTYHWCVILDPAGGTVPELNESNNTLVGNQIVVSTGG